MYWKHPELHYTVLFFLRLGEEGHEKPKKRKKLLEKYGSFSLSFGTFSQGLENKKNLIVVDKKCCVWKIVCHCALLYFNCGETVLERSWNQDLIVQHKNKKKRNHIGFLFFLIIFFMKIQNYKPKIFQKVWESYKLKFLVGEGW